MQVLYFDYKLFTKTSGLQIVGNAKVYSHSCILLVFPLQLLNLTGISRSNLFMLDFVMNVTIYNENEKNIHLS